MKSWSLIVWSAQIFAAASLAKCMGTHLGPSSGWDRPKLQYMALCKPLCDMVRGHCLI